MNPMTTVPAEMDRMDRVDPVPPVAAPTATSVSPSAARQEPVMGLRQAIVHDVRHGIPEAASSLLRTIVVALFVLTFIAQPMVIPSESMEHTLLVGDFLLMNRSTLAPAGSGNASCPMPGCSAGRLSPFTHH
jgi:hypothetical protein